jgi:hypothetical protein
MANVLYLVGEAVNAVTVVAGDALGAALPPERAVPWSHQTTSGHDHDRPPSSSSGTGGSPVAGFQDAELRLVLAPWRAAALPLRRRRAALPAGPGRARPAEPPPDEFAEAPQQPRRTE